MFITDLLDAALNGFIDVLAGGLSGYEGQPGNQGGHNGGGLRGYEGQPGNQGG
jgi:hypothetical protein